MTTPSQEPTPQERTMALLREAQACGEEMHKAAWDILAGYAKECSRLLNWQKLAGRALAREGLATETFSEEINRLIEIERAKLEANVRELLNEHRKEQKEERGEQD